MTEASLTESSVQIADPEAALLHHCNKLIRSHIEAEVSAERDIRRISVCIGADCAIYPSVVIEPISAVILMCASIVLPYSSVVSAEVLIRMIVLLRIVGVVGRVAVICVVAVHSGRIGVFERIIENVAVQV